MIRSRKRPISDRIFWNGNRFGRQGCVSSPMASEEAARIRLFEKPWLDRFRALLPPAAPVLDIGCGSAAPMAAYLIELGHLVVGVDSSPAMIDACRRHFPEQEWIVADMRKLALQRKFP